MGQLDIGNQKWKVHKMQSIDGQTVPTPIIDNFIGMNRKQLRNSHYVNKAAHRLYWSTFTLRKVRKYQEQHGDNFCLIITREGEELDCFVFPFWKLKEHFTEASAYKGVGWKLYINHGKVFLEGTVGPVFDATEYYNAVEHIHPDGHIAANRIKSTLAALEMSSNGDVLTQIATFNQLFAEIPPTERTIASRLIERPGSITDHLKKLHNYTCQLCGCEGFEQAGGSKYVEAHHLIELHAKIPGSYCSDNIIIVCATCHKKLHFAKHRTIVYIDGDRVRVELNNETYEFSRNIVRPKCAKTPASVAK